MGAGVVGAGVGVDQLGVAAETHTPTVDALDLHVTTRLGTWRRRGKAASRCSQL